MAFGLTSDIQDFFRIPLPEEPENSWYFKEHKKPLHKTDLLGCSHRYAPEQYLFYSFCKKKIPELDFENYLDYNIKNISDYENLLLTNFLVLDPAQFKYISLDHRYTQWTRDTFSLPDEILSGLYTNKKFLSEVNKTK